MVPAVAHRVALAPGPGSHSCYRCCQQGHWPWKDLVRFGKIIWNALTCLEMWRLICTPWIFSNRLTLQRFHEPMGFGCLWGPGVDPFDMFRRKWICFASAMSFYLQFLTKAIPISLIVLGSLISLISALPTAHWSKSMPHASINRGPTIDRPYNILFMTIASEIMKLDNSIQTSTEVLRPCLHWSNLGISGWRSMFGQNFGFGVARTPDVGRLEHGTFHEPKWSDLPVSLESLDWLQKTDMQIDQIDKRWWRYVSLTRLGMVISPMAQELTSSSLHPCHPMSLWRLRSWSDNGGWVWLWGLTGQDLAAITC